MRDKTRKEFTFPFSTLTGGRISTFLALSFRNRISYQKMGRYVLSLLICGILEPFRWIERIRDHRRISRTKLEEPPWFVIGFWRGGTTLMHELLTADKRFFYVTTYQTIFPELMHAKPVLKSLTKFFMPDYRPVDKMKLDLEYPQEEEIGIANYHRYSFYHFFYFPHDYPSIRDSSLKLREQGERRVQKWLDTYQTLVIKAYLNQNRSGNVFLSKNPANTYRIRELLKKYPNAKFIYLYRDPDRVLSSFYLFISQVIDGIGFQVIEKERFNEFMTDLFKLMIERFEEDKTAIPEKNLVEIGFEDFVKEPREYLTKIYRQFNTTIDKATAEKIEKTLSKYKDHKSGQYKIDPVIKGLVEEHFTEWMKEKGYR
jgi:hypothetical protein